jgi:hypothetical protein
MSPVVARLQASMPPALDDVGGLVQDLHRARVQLAAVLVQEEGHRHAPAALAADAPVGTVGDHVAQPGLAVVGVEAGVVDGVQRQLAQRLGRLVFGETRLRLRPCG